MAKNPNKEMYHNQMMEMARESKETLLIRKEIILDDDTTDEQLGTIIRQMYRAKCKAADEHIAHLKRNLNEG